MNDTAFQKAIDEWLSDVRHEALSLQTDGCCSEHCLKIATQIADSKAQKRALERQTAAARLTLPPSLSPRGNA